MQVEILSLCDFAAIYDHKLNVIGIYETLFAPTVPVHIESGAIAVRIRFDALESGIKNLRLAIVNTDGHRIAPVLEQPLDLSSIDDKHTSVIQMVVPIRLLPISSFGEHSIQLSVDGRMERETPIFIHPTPPVQQSAEVRTS